MNEMIEDLGVNIFWIFFQGLATGLGCWGNTSNQS
jgi:hypothetical protein